jgi:hypothetical protein
MRGGFMTTEITLTVQGCARAGDKMASMDTNEPATWSPWTTSYLSNGGPGSRQWVGWYACRHTTDHETRPGVGMLSSFMGPFGSEAEAAKWCAVENGPLECKPRPNLPAQLSYSREKAFWDAFLAADNKQADEPLAVEARQ